MIIKDGYNRKELEINISHNGGRMANMFINFREEVIPSETLNILTLEELLKLRDECNKVIQEIRKVENREKRFIIGEWRKIYYIGSDGKEYEGECFYRYTKKEIKKIWEKME